MFGAPPEVHSEILDEIRFMQWMEAWRMIGDAAFIDGNIRQQPESSRVALREYVDNIRSLFGRR